MSNLTIIIRNDQDARKLVEKLKSQPYPFTLMFKEGEQSRSQRQNRLFWEWLKDAERQGDQLALEYRAEMKLTKGVPILRQENDDFAIQYDQSIKPMPYPEKLALMLPPIELPVTSLMTVKQMSAFLNLVHQHFTGLGMTLTDPQLMGLEQGRY